MLSLRPNPTLKLNCFCFAVILNRSVALLCVTLKVKPDSALKRLHLITVERSMEKGIAVITSAFSKPGSKFANFTKKFNEFSHNEVVISGAFSWKKV